MGKMPFRSSVDGNELSNGVEMIQGSQLEVVGRKTSELGYDSLYDMNPDHIHTFQLFCIPLRYHERWRDSLKLHEELETDIVRFDFCPGVSIFVNRDGQPISESGSNLLSDTDRWRLMKSLSGTG